MYVVMRGDGRAVQGRGLVVPAPEGGLDFFVDAMPDGLDNPGVDHIALGINGDFDDDVAGKVARKLSTVNRRIGVNDGIGYMDFMAGNWAVDDCAERRSGLGGDVTRLRIRFTGMKLLGGPRFSHLGAQWGKSGLCPRQDQLGLSGQIFYTAGRKVRDVVSMGGVSGGQPGRSEVDNSRAAKSDNGQHAQMNGHGCDDETMAQEPGAQNRFASC